MVLFASNGSILLKKIKQFVSFLVNFTFLIKKYTRIFEKKKKMLFFYKNG